MQEPPDLIPRIERMAGQRVVQRRKTTGGYSIAIREIMTFADGSTAFIKAGRNIPNSDLARYIRREHQVYETLHGDFLPRLLAFADDGDMPILMLEDLSHAHFPPPWTRQQVDLVLTALQHISRQHFEDARPIRDEAHILHGWRTVADDPAPFLSLGLADEHWLKAALPTLLAIDVERAVDGDEILHMDVRSDNLCLLPSRAVLFDWNWISRGNRKLDIAAWLPSLHAEGGPAPEEILPNAPEFATILSGFFAQFAGLPPIPQVPNLRKVQLQQLKAALPWTVRALGLPRAGLNLVVA